VQVSRPAVPTGLGKAGLLGGEQVGVRLAVQVVGPHDQRVLTGLGVVLGAHSDRREAEPRVQALRPAVVDADLQCRRLGSQPAGIAQQPDQQPRSDLATVVVRMRRDGGDVGLPHGDHHAGVADDAAPRQPTADATIQRDQIPARLGLGDLGSEQRR
jgi:hypothetical protein